MQNIYEIEILMKYDNNIFYNRYICTKILNLINNFYEINII